MEYLDFTGIDQQQDMLLHCYRQIRQNELLQYLERTGYQFHNLSIFNFPGEKAITQPTFLPRGKLLINSQTFLSRIKHELGYHLYTTLGLEQGPPKNIYIDRENNELLYSNTLKLARTLSSQPRFIYTHLMMPHYPYYYTRQGQQRPLEQLLVKSKVNREYYLDYLVYSNQLILQLIREVKGNNPDDIIVLAGDHGFRAFDGQVETRPMFNNLCAVFLPSGDYSRFHDGMSLVNLFRIIGNTEFGQTVPMLKDSCVLGLEK
jgi:hypothetical protein